jgi:acyl-CoA thioesterase FadM
MAIHLTSQNILKDWTDYNNHMNVAYYVLIFDIYGAEKLMTTFNMGEPSLTYIVIFFYRDQNRVDLHQLCHLLSLPDYK